MMKKHGVNNVRGASWCKEHLIEKQIRDLYFILSENDDVDSNEFIKQLKAFKKDPIKNQ